MTKPRHTLPAMTAATAVTALTVLALSACSTPTAPNIGPAPQDLATHLVQLDAGGTTTPAPADVTAAQKALTRLGTICTGTHQSNADRVNTTHDALAKKAINRSRLTILTTLAKAGTPTTSFVPCSDLFDAYLTVAPPVTPNPGPSPVNTPNVDQQKDIDTGIGADLKAMAITEAAAITKPPTTGAVPWNGTTKLPSALKNFKPVKGNHVTVTVKTGVGYCISVINPGSTRGIKPTWYDSAAGGTQTYTTLPPASKTLACSQ